jgi:hypothetical protein
MTDRELIEHLKKSLPLCENGGDIADEIMLINKHLGLDPEDGLPV